MSTLAAFFTVCLLIVLVTPVLLWQIHRAWKAEQAKYGADPTPDPRWGTDTALHDECALILSLPSYSASRERLKKQIASDPHCEAAFRRIAEDHELAPDLADFAERLLEESRDDGDDHTTTNPTGD